MKRNFTLRQGGEKKDKIWVEISNKANDDILCAWLPKDQIKITNRTYGFGGRMNADIELPISLVKLFKSIYSDLGKLTGDFIAAGHGGIWIVDNKDHTYTLNGFDKTPITGSLSTLKALIEPTK